MTITSRFQAIAIAGLCAFCWPFSIFLLCLNYAILATSRRKPLRALVRRMPGFKARTILITGSTPYALRLARALHETGHHVHIATRQDGLLPLHTAFSFARRRYIRLKTDSPSRDPPAYIQELIKIVSDEHIELWIDCQTDTPASLLTQAKAIIERKTKCVCFSSVQTDVPIFRKSSTFLKFAAEHGLSVPESYDVKSRNDIHKILHQSNGKRKYILSDTNGVETALPSMLLPRRTLSQTYDEVARVKILQNSKLRLYQAVEDGGRYRSTSIIVNGKVKAFAACTFTPEDSTTSLPSSYTALSPSSTLSLAMLQFVASFTSKLDSYTGHLTIDFTVDERPSSSNSAAIEKRILPTSARTSPDTPILLFTGLEGSINLVRAYVSVFGRSANGFIRGDDEVSLATNSSSSATPSSQQDQTNQPRDLGIYALGPSLSRLLVLPILRLLTLRPQPDDGGVFYVLGAAIAFARQLLCWQESVYDFNDPLPFWYLYQIYIPLRLVGAALRRGESVGEVGRELSGLVL